MKKKEESKTVRPKKAQVDACLQSKSSERAAHVAPSKGAKSHRSTTPAKISEDGHGILQRIGQAIVDKKGLNLVTLDVRGVSSMTDYFVIAEGTVDRHVVALAKHIQSVMKDEGRLSFHAEGLREGDWVVLDYMDVVIHLFVPELRQHYALEEVWKEGKIVNLPLDYGSTPKAASHTHHEST